MTWFVQQRPDGWIVVHTESGIEVGYHGTEQEANSHLAALYGGDVTALNDALDILDDDLDALYEDDES
jgi:hypothetical protein